MKPTITFTIYMFILLLLSNRALYWFTAVGSETVFYSNKCYKLPDWLLPRSYCYFPPKSPDTPCVPISYCYFPPKPPDTLCVPRSYCYFPPKPRDTLCVIMWSICQHCFLFIVSQRPVQSRSETKNWKFSVRPSVRPSVSCLTTPAYRIVSS